MINHWKIKGAKQHLGTPSVFLAMFEILDVNVFSLAVYKYVKQSAQSGLSGTMEVQDLRSVRGAGEHNPKNWNISSRLSTESHPQKGKTRNRNKVGSWSWLNGPYWMGLGPSQPGSSTRSSSRRPCLRFNQWAQLWT